jgi:RimJ/RimL family protein N-acetyltransferase
MLCAPVVVVPVMNAAVLELPDGGRFLIRPIRADDKALLSAAFERMSLRDRYLRFFSPMQELPAPMLTALTEIDYIDRFAWVALACEGDREALAGVARYVRLDDPTTAELALTVVDPYQGRGIAHLLLDALVLEAHRAGVQRFEGEALGENAAIRAVLTDAGAQLRLGQQPGAVHFAFELAPRAEILRGRPGYAVLDRLASDAAAVHSPTTAGEALTAH